MGDATADFRFVDIGTAGCSNQDARQELWPARPFRETRMVEVEPNEYHLAQTMCRANCQRSIDSGSDFIHEHRAVDFHQPSYFRAGALKRFVLPSDRSARKGFKP